MESLAGPLRVDGVMFDLNGTLIDSVEVYYRIVEVALEQMGMPPVPRRRILEAAQDGEFDWHQVLPPDTMGSRKALVRKGWQVVADVYPDMFRNGVELVPGTVEIVNRLADAGLKLGIVTSTPRVNMADKIHLLEAAGIFGRFEAVVASEDAPRKKPAPDPLIACSQSLGVAAGKNVYVGDTRIDILAGRAAGMKTIGVLTGFEGREDLSSAGPDAILPSVAELAGPVGPFGFRCPVSGVRPAAGR
jgi:HAD superfamily hydrolase (TIGR01509 family)